LILPKDKVISPAVLSAAEWEYSLIERVSSRLNRSRSYTLLDIGANIGAICLPLAFRHPAARIFAVEPTDHAFKRLNRNLELNPELQERVKPIQSFMGDGSQPSASMIAYPSWRLDTKGGARHEVHLGQVHEVSCPTLTIDDLAEREKLATLDFIKIDTDGHELDILRGGWQTLRRLRPIVVFEFCFYESEKRGYGFKAFADFFDALGYDIWLCDKSAKITNDADAGRFTSRLGSGDFAAIPRQIL
jgi:FkbM family methyltransferase